MYPPRAALMTSVILRVARACKLPSSPYPSPLFTQYRNMSSPTSSRIPPGLEEIPHEEIHKLWFGEEYLKDLDSPPGQEAFMKWFRQSDVFDEELRSLAGKHVEELSRIRPSEIVPLYQTLSKTFKSPLEHLTLILLLDQIPRNLFRGPACRKVYRTYDPISVELAKHLISDPSHEGDIRPLDKHPTLIHRPALRQFLYLPLMHSESPTIQKLAVEKYRSQIEDVPNGGWQEEMAKKLETFGLEHKVIIDRWGRYPYRNDVLGREWMEGEKEWMDKHGKDYSAGAKEET